MTETHEPSRVIGAQLAEVLEDIRKRPVSQLFDMVEEMLASLRDRDILRKSYNRGMRKDPAELLKDALSLHREERAALADSLLRSLDQERDQGVEQAWLD